MLKLKLRIATGLFLSLLSLSAPAALAADKEGETVEDFLQKFSTIPDVVNRKDPFIQAAAPFSAPKDSTEGTDLSVPALERYAITKYEVVATLLGDQYPRALLRLPKEEKSKVVIVKEKDKLGNEGGIITKILKDGISVVQKTRSPLGFIDKQDTIIRVGSADEDAKPDQKPQPIIQGAPAPSAQPFSTGGQGNSPYRR